MDEKTSYKFSNGTVECADVQNLHTVLDDPQVFYLLDNMEPAIPAKLSCFLQIENAARIMKREGQLTQG